MLIALNFFSTAKNESEALKWINPQKSNTLLVIQTCSAEYQHNQDPQKPNEFGCYTNIDMSTFQQD